MVKDLVGLHPLRFGALTSTYLATNVYIAENKFGLHPLRFGALTST